MLGKCFLPSEAQSRMPEIGTSVSMSGEGKRRGLGIVLMYALAFDINDTEVVLGSGVTLLASLSEPLDRIRIILRDTLSLGVRETEAVLGAGVALLGGQAPPLHRLGPVEWLGFGVAALGLEWD